MEKNKLLRAIQMYDFALYELNLYLDTHPDCLEALKYFRQYKELRNCAYDEYTSLYGSVTAIQNTDDLHWEWIDEPWPWERSVN